MPELPDVEVFRRYIDATSLHQRIEHVRVLDDDLLHRVTRQKLAATLTDHELTRTDRHGKFLGARADAGPWLILHFGMTGLVRYAHDDADRPDHTALTLEMAGHARLWYANVRKLGRVTLADDFDAFIESEGLGPDAMNVDPDTLRDLLAATSARLKSALMDQSRLAGLGNIYTDEILFHAGVRPDHRADEIDADQVRAIHRALRHVLRHVLRKAVEVKADPEHMPSTWIIPRRTDDGRCPRCARPLQAAKVAGRTTYFCPSCQT